MKLECYDVGGTWIRGAVIDGGRILEQGKVPARRDFLGQIRAFSTHYAPKYRTDGVVVVVPGPVEDGILLSAPPLGITSQVDVRRELSDICSPVHVANDVDAAMEGEIAYGAGRKFRSFYLLTISTGIGSALAVDGKRVPSMAGEFGHTVLREYGRNSFPCGCGNHGCWVAVSAGIGFRNMSRMYLGQEMEAGEVFRLAETHSKAREVITMARAYNAQGIGNMINASPVEAIAVMGSIGLQQFDRVIPSPSEIEAYTVFKKRIPKIVKTELGDDIGLLGASIIGERK